MEARTKSQAIFRPAADLKYIAFFKPYGVLSQFSREPGSDKRSLAEFSFPERVYPLGRLDYDSEGLLLLSDDKRLNNILLDPQMGHRRIYWAQVEHIPNENALKSLATGVTIEGRKTLPARVRLLNEAPNLEERPVPIRYRKNIPTAWIELEIKEGKNRQVRKMTAAVGHPTLRLVRAAIGKLNLADLEIAAGYWKYLSPEDLLKCFD